MITTTEGMLDLQWREIPQNCDSCCFSGTGLTAAPCPETGNIIGDNTGVYVGGIPDDMVLVQPELESDSRRGVRNLE